MKPWRSTTALVCLGLLNACQDAEVGAPAAGSPTPAAPARTAPALAIKASCVIQAQRMVKLKPELGGALAQVHVKLGERVREGQVLAVLRSDELGLDLARQALQMEQTQERIQLLQRQHQRAQGEWSALQGLYVQAHAPGAEMAKEAMLVSEKESELRLARLQLRELQLQGERLRRQLRQAEIRSPIQGIVLSRNAEVGMVVAPGAASLTGSDVLFELGDPDRLKAECAAREGDAARLRLGAPMSLKLDGAAPNDAPLRMRLTGMAPAISNQGGAAVLSFWAEFERPADQQVLPGMHAMAQVELQSSPVDRVQP